MADPRRAVASEVMDGIALITFSVPPRNAMDEAAWAALPGLLAHHAADPAVRVLVLTGAGHHAFVTDLPPAGAGQAALDAAVRDAQHALAAFAKPVIVRVRGDCTGAGMLLAMQGDIIVAAEDSAFGLPGVRRGAATPPEAVARLVSLVGPQQARRMLFTGGRVAAREALRIGLVALVVEDADLSDMVVDMARDIADNPAAAVDAAKRMVANPGDPALEDLFQSCRDAAPGP